MSTVNVKSIFRIFYLMISQNEQKFLEKLHKKCKFWHHSSGTIRYIYLRIFVIPHTINSRFFFLTDLIPYRYVFIECICRSPCQSGVHRCYVRSVIATRIYHFISKSRCISKSLPIKYRRTQLEESHQLSMAYVRILAYLARILFNPSLPQIEYLSAGFRYRLFWV